MSSRLIRWFIAGLLIGATAVGLVFWGVILGRTGSNRNAISQSQVPDTVYISGGQQQGVSQDELDKSTANQILHTSRANGITESISQASPAVVGISVTQVREYRERNYLNSDPLFRYFFGIPDRTYRQSVESIGSGFFISSDGYVVTNEHVVHNAVEIMVTMSSGRSFEAEVIGTDYDTDLALLKVDSRNLPYLKIAEYEDVIVGEWVMAIGNPFGLFQVNDQPSVSVGVISAIGRDFERQEDGRLYSSMLQTDAAINPGNSGGPLVNVFGEVIGVNTFIFTGGGNGSVGVGFAIPSSILNDVLGELKDRGGINRDFWSGLYVQNLNRMIAMSLNYKENYGVIITEIDKDSPGEKAGLKPTDIIQKIGGTVITDTRFIRNYFDNRDLRVGDELDLEIFRDGKSLTVKMVLEARPR